MAIRNIVKSDNDVLTKKCKPVVDFDVKLHNLLDDMKETLKKARGVGLACPQVGFLKRAAIIDMGYIGWQKRKEDYYRETEENSDKKAKIPDFPEDYDEFFLEMINPELSNFEGEQTDVEGCLSCPGQWGYVTRPLKCHLRAQNRFGEWYDMEFDGLAARCAMHECDHLDGLLFVRLVDEWCES